MTFLLSVTVKSALLTLAALAAMPFLRRQSAALRHLVLATALFGCVCIPVLELFVPAWSIPLPVTFASSSVNSSIRLVSEAPPLVPRPDGTRADERTAGGRTHLPDFTIVTASIWIAGVLVGVAILIAGLWRLRTLAADSNVVSSGAWRDLADEVTRRYQIRRSIRLLACPHPAMLATWGAVNPTILLPCEALRWSDDRIRAVLHHELAHVRRGDWTIALTANLLRAVYWFNPLMWIAFRRLRHEGERACDDLVLTSGISGAEYAAHLLDVARASVQRRHPWSPAIAIAHRSMLERRVRAMLSARVNREPLSVVVRTTTLAVLATVTASIGAITVSGNSIVASKPDVALIESGTLPVLTPEPGRRTVERARRATAPAAQTQPAGGAIEGVLYDQYGGLLPGVSVRLTPVSSDSSQNTLSDRTGSFAFRGLTAGDYEIVTDLPGFTAVRNLIRAEPGTTVRRYIMVPIGTVEETIHVTCAIADLNTSKPTAPRGATTPGPASRQTGAGQFPIEPKMTATFTGGIGGQIKAPRKLVHVNPICPTGVTAETTVVKLAGRIGIDGQFSDLHNISADTPAPFVESAMTAARQWGFTPTLLNNAPIETNINVTISYSWN
jgi:beta-lactamase regulating signal transducer with metallopeptidase domain